MWGPEQIKQYVQQVQNNLRAQLSQQIEQARAAMFLFTTITTASEGENNRNPLKDTCEGHDTAGDDEGGTVPPPAEADAQRIELPGFAFVPLTGQPSILAGFAANLFHFALASTRWRPAGLKQGETCQYNLNEKQTTFKISQQGQVDLVAAQDAQVEIRNAKGSVVTILPSGQINIDTRGASPQPDVIVNGGELRVARDTDPVDWGSCTATAGPYPVMFTYFAPGSATPGPPDATLIPSPVIDGGADHFKG